MLNRIYARQQVWPEYSTVASESFKPNNRLNSGRYKYQKRSFLADTCDESVMLENEDLLLSYLQRYSDYSL